MGGRMLRVLGGLCVTSDDGVREVRGAGRQRVLSLLASRPNQFIDTTTLIAEAWTGVPPASARSAIRNRITSLRRTLGIGQTNGPFLKTTGRGYCLVAGVEDLDLLLFESLVAQSRTVKNPTAQIEILTRALGLWQGEPFGGIDLFMVRPTVLALDEIRHGVQRQLVDAYLAVGDHVSARTAIEPEQAAHDEQACAQLMVALYRSGRPTDALAAFQTLANQLDSHGLVPGPEVRQLEIAILRHDDAILRRSASVHDSSVKLTSVVGPFPPSPIGAAQRFDGQLVVAETNVRLGFWSAAIDAYMDAFAAAKGGHRTDSAASILLRVARITWDKDLGDTVDREMRTLLLDISDACLAAQTRTYLSAGAYQTGETSTNYTGGTQLERDIGTVREHGTKSELAWTLLKARDAASGVSSPQHLLELSEAAVSSSTEDRSAKRQALTARYVDLLRCGRIPAAHDTLKKLKLSLDAPTPAVDRFGAITAENCWDLATGRFDKVETGLLELLEYQGRLGAHTYDQVVLGQSFWLTRETGDDESLERHLRGVTSLLDNDPTNLLWVAARCCLLTDLLDAKRAVRELQTSGLLRHITAVPPGAHRTGILSFAAETLGAARLQGCDFDGSIATELLEALAGLPDVGVLFGWPTVYAGSKKRFLGFAAIAANEIEKARRHLGEAVDEDRDLPPLHKRSRNALDAARR